MPAGLSIDAVPRELATGLGLRRVVQSSEWLWNAIAERRVDDDEGGPMVQAGRQDDWIAEIKAKANELAPPSHRAADDVRNLMALHGLATEGMSETDVAALFTCRWRS